MGVGLQDWLEAQHGVLGSVLISPELAPKVISQMTDSDFSGKCVAVFQAIRNLFSQAIPIDVISVRDKLGADYSPFLMQLMEVTPTAANYQSYIDLARKQARTQQLRDIGQQMSMAETPEAVQELFERAVVISSENQSLRAVTMREAMVDFIHRMVGESPDYLPWPIKGIAKKLFIGEGDFVVLGARPSVGKTAFALQCAWEMSKTRRVGFFSVETGIRKLTERQVANVCDVPLGDIKNRVLNGARQEAFIRFCDGEAATCGLEIIHAPSSTVSEICAYSAARQYDVIFIDYLQIVTASGRSPYERITEISIALHKFAQSSGTVVIALSQLNRGGDGNNPDMTSLRESGQLEQDADAVLLLYLDDEKAPNGPRVLRCAKNKDGERFRVKLDFDGKHQRFSKYGDNFGRLPGNLPVPFETVGGIL